jgi:hypothetical protein
VEENDIAEDGVPGVMIANSESALEAMLADETDTLLSEGEMGIAILVFPVDMVAFLGIEVAEDGSIDLAAAVAAFFESTMADEDAEDIEVGEPGEIELDEERMAGYIEVADSEVEGAMLFFEVGDGVYAMAFAGAFPGEFSEEFALTTLVVAASLTVDATGDELFEYMMSGGMMGDYGDEYLDGEALVLERCTVCHDTARIENATKDEAGWTETVDRMIKNGAVLSEEERAAVIAYLSGME